MSDDFFTPPPFKADDALQGLRRELRALRLTEREGHFELQGRPVVTLEVQAGAITARTVKRSAQSPDWTSTTLRHAADVRRFTEELRRQLARWSERDD